MYIKILVILIIVTILYLTFKNYTEYITITGNCGLNYKVFRCKNPQISANMLCILNNRCMKLIQYLKTKYGENNGMVKLLIDEYDNDDFIEDTSSYNIGKGSSIGVCLKNSEGIYYPINFLMFIIIHELAHIITKKYKHSTIFWENNVWLMKEAHAIGVYLPKNYSHYPIKYCGMNINSNPYYVL